MLSLNALRAPSVEPSPGAGHIATAEAPPHIATIETSPFLELMRIRTGRIGSFVVGRAGPRIMVAALLAACRQSEGSYQGYATRAAAVGDSALLTVASYLTKDSTETIVWNADASRELERLATELGGIMRPDTVDVFHRQMLEGLDSLVVAMRVLHDREESCARERTIDCVDARDFGHVLESMRTGARTYLDARRRMRETLAPLGAHVPDPPGVSPSALRPRAATRESS